MTRELKFVTVCPIDNYFCWQVNMWLESLREIGHSNNAVVLLFEPLGRTNPKWKQVMDLYPEAEFHIYKDDGTVQPLLGIYIPILRLYTMSRYCKEFPEITDKAVLYCDSDILFNKDFNIDHLLDDDIIYGSDTNSYISASYFDSKIKDVLPAKLEQYKTIDVLNEAAKIVGIDRQTCEKNNLHSIGTQYLLKNTNEQFWKNIMDKCIPLLSYLRGINREYFESESKGYQSWTADMWLVLWELWRLGYETKVVKEMSFAWATNGIEKLSDPIFHNAGVTGTRMFQTKENPQGIPMFYKGKYIGGQDPTLDPFLDEILNHTESKKLCTWYYTKKLIDLKQKYNINY